MSRALRAASCLLIALVASCERIDTPAEPAKVVAVSGEAARALARPDPRLTIAHRGTRVIELAPDPSSTLSYRESVATDGHGRFSIEPLGPAGTTVQDWGQFELTQRAREGFLFRYRDFSVRDPQLFQRNWSVTSQTSAQIAGRACRSYRLERVVGDSIAYEVALDEATGLVLASREYDAEGRLLASMAYETLDLAPDLGGVAWHVQANDERVLEPQDLSTTTELEPRLLPDGYEPLEVATVADGDGARWIKRTYSDGIEPLFFFQGLGDAAQGKTPLTGARSIGDAQQVPSAVVAFHLGAVTAIQGEVSGFDLMVIGTVAEEELLDLLESALP